MRSSLFFLSVSITAALADADNYRAAPCVCTEYSQIVPAVSSCTEITLRDIAAPSDGSINLSKLKANSVVTFAGKTTFEFTNSSSFNSMTFGGKNVTITATSDAIIDGGGQLYWDGLGSNGGVPKPNHFIVVKMTQGSIGGSSDLTIRDIILGNSAGDAPNDRSNGLPAAHNSDGLGVGSSSNILITNVSVHNQDDCVAVTSGNNITVSNMYCYGSHGLSIGSIGGKSNNNVTNVLFTNSTLVNSTIGARIKSNFNTTGFISNITYSNIRLENIDTYGIDVQQDYLNGGPTGSPSNGVIISNIHFKNVTGTMKTGGTNYYVLCGDRSCSNVEFEDVRITGGRKNSFCNFPKNGCPS
ncbi:hypothetical protein EG329_011680 [Mollisiaceae sp. DMI_Dod_QoI]|nr:hypothetical protein EG329_011680 [Helotiales sp. DMI_Dod_QoI]